MIERHTGETIKIERTVTNQDGTVASLVGAVAKFSMKSRFGGVSILKSCVVDEENSTISVTLLPTETTHDGTYDYEFKVKLNGEYDTVERDELVLLKSDIPSTF